ncbi:LPXTG cell wall anchor domain-containing protein, partial [Micromonospora aurantiaca]|nr:LPXTG cell wall anchor domain-containing protein [Micromonospora aurantiaca]
MSFDRAYRDASVTSRLDRIADLMLSGNAKKEYDRQTAAIDKRAKERGLESPGARDDGSPVLPIALGAAGVAAAGIGGLLLWRRRR